MRLVVFTDLDGTLLDHASYSFQPARPALDALRRLGVPLILASSKTVAEIAPLHGELQLNGWPAIVENGAGVFEPGARGEEDASEYCRIRDALATLPQALARCFHGFGDMSDAGVAEVTGLPLAQAALARRRRHSEPGLWSGSDDDLGRFLTALDAEGISGRRGGRFLTLSFGRTKAGAMGEIVQRLGADRTVALGDAPNDAEMLEAADIGVIVRNDHAPAMPDLAGESCGRIRRTSLPGPQGWNEAILAILHETGLN